MAFSSTEGKQFFKDWFRSFCPMKVLDVGPGAGVYADLIHEVESQLIQKAARKAFDGSGSWGEVTKCFESEIMITGLEIYEPYIEQFGLKQKYDQLIKGDIVNLVEKIENFDLIIFGDVLEHLKKEVALKVWKKAKERSRFLWLSMPVRPAPDLNWYVGYNQPPEDYAKNPHEKHVHMWGFDELLQSLGPFLWQAPFKTIVVLIAEGER